MSFLARLEGIVDRVLAAVAVGLVVGIVAVVLIQIVGRYFLSISLPWPEEIARHAMVWAVFIGGALALRRSSMVRVDIVLLRLPPRVRRVLELIGDVVSVMGLLILLAASLPLLGPAGDTAEPGAGIPQRWVSLALPVGVVLMVLFTVAKALRVDRGITLRPEELVQELVEPPL